uniref:Reverse transcriptase n=1 Tax=Cannabis sativa TaxID=3483 RepID=A0A803NTY1_CANSA
MHNPTSNRRNNLIQKLKNNDGNWVGWEDDLPTVVTEYFHQLFTNEDVDFRAVIDCVHPQITAEQKEKLIEFIPAEEIKQALFQMHPEKSPGPDGMTPDFYQKFWHIVGDDIVSLVRNFFTTGQFPNKLNETNIVLIPKKKLPEHMSELRPISL